MKELMNRVDNLTKELDSSTLMSSLQDALKEVKKDKKLMSLLEEYSYYPTEKIKKKILENDTFQKYKVQETELNLFIMEMNHKLKIISDKGSCHHESH